MWEWFCYDDGEEDSLWHRWYHGADDVVQGKHETIIDFLEVRSADQWRRPHTGMINDEIIEICVHGKVQHRLLGFFGPERGQFTFVIACTHKQNVYAPAGAKKTAAKRKKEIEDGEANAISCQRPQKT